MAESKTYNTKTGKWETRNVDDWTKDERTQFGVGSEGNIDQRTANAILKQRRSKGFGGVTSSELSQREQDAYSKALQELDGSGTGKGTGGYKSMIDALTKLGNFSSQGINDSMDTLMRTLGGQSNPYAGFQAQQTATTPELSQLLQSQGVSTDPLQQFAAATNAQNMGQATAFQNQANTMRDIYGAEQAGAVSDVAAQRAQLLNSLQANTFGTGAALMGKKAPDRNSIVQMLLAAMKNRA